MLTTITPYWGRPTMLRVWLRAVSGATCNGFKHIVIFVGESVPDWVQSQYGEDPRFKLVSFADHTPGHFSIGHYHNMGAFLATTEWMMKMDVDTIPNVQYFQALVGLLNHAQPREWFNGGMMYVSEASSAQYLAAEKMPLKEETYNTIMGNTRLHCGGYFAGPSATNFICRRKEYLELGGSDEKFRGYGWEDYQQIYMLERHFLGRDPLPGPLDESNVTRRCCGEISRIRAHGLWKRNPWLCLLHHWHPASPDTRYKSHMGMIANRKILLDCINQVRTGEYKL